MRVSICQHSPKHAYIQIHCICDTISSNRKVQRMKKSRKRFAFGADLLMPLFKMESYIKLEEGKSFESWQRNVAETLPHSSPSRVSTFIRMRCRAVLSAICYAMSCCSKEKAHLMSCKNGSSMLSISKHTEKTKSLGATHSTCIWTSSGDRPESLD